MHLIDAERTQAALDFPSLIDCLREAFQGECAAPLRTHHSITRDKQPEATLLLMPAWRDGGAIGVKLATVFPGNAAKGLPAVMGSYLLLDGGTGQVQAVIDGPALTARRTAAASALAADYLARADSRRLLMVGAGVLAPNLIAAHRSVRPIAEVSIWNHNPERAAALADELAEDGLEVRAIDDLQASAAEADIISCATLSQQPLIQGDWLKPGAHLDLVGGFTPEMRETDDTAVRRAQVYVDTRMGATNEAGDIVDPLKRGVIDEADIVGDLFDLTRGQVKGRQDAADITLFKSVGTALEDLAAAELVYRRNP